MLSLIFRDAKELLCHGQNLDADVLLKNGEHGLEESRKLQHGDFTPQKVKGFPLGY